MPVVGERKHSNNKAYANDPMNKLCKEYLELANNLLEEDRVDLFSETAQACRRESSKNALKDFFINNSYDENSNNMTAAQVEDHIAMMEAYFDNDMYTMMNPVNEYTAMATVNPVVGTTLPLHKNLIMNNVFTQTDAIPKAVARSPKWTESMEFRYLVKPDGTKIDFYTEQNKMTAAIDETAPFKTVELKLPEIGTTNILEKIGASDNDNLSVDVHVTGIAVPVKTPEATDEKCTIEGLEACIWLPCNIPFGPAYGTTQRVLTRTVDPVKMGVKADNLDSVDENHADDKLAGTMDNNVLTFTSLKGLVKAVRIRARKDTSSAMLETCSVMWEEVTDFYEIPNAIPINVPISPEEIKDYAALYDVNQLTKIMSMIKIALANYKDDKILDFLNYSWEHIPASQSNYAEIDWAPRHSYTDTHVDWRHKVTFDQLDSFVSPLAYSLNDPNMVVTFFGRPDIVRKITPTEYSYESPKEIGSIPLEFKKKVSTSDDRSYQFISSLKFESGKQGVGDRGLGDEMICILSPRNTNRIVYKIYDYQLYFSNEIRNVTNYALPAVHAFERWRPFEYQPIQGRVKILNASGFADRPFDVKVRP